MYAAVLRGLTSRRAGATGGAGGSSSTHGEPPAPSQATSMQPGGSSRAGSARPEEVEISVLGSDVGAEGGRGGEGGAGRGGAGGESGESSTARDSGNPAVVVIEDVSGNIYLGVDPDKYEKHRAEQQERIAAERLANPQMHALEDDGFMDNEDYIRFADEYQLALIDRRKKGCLFLLGMDIVYLVFIALLPFIIPYRSSSSPDVSSDSPWPSPANGSSPNATDSAYATYNGTSYNYTYNGSTYFSPSGDSSSMDTTFFGAVDRTIMELIFFLAIDILGIIACIKGSPPLLTIFVLLLSCVTVLTAIRSLSPVLVFRMIIIMLALQLRASILLARPIDSGGGGHGHEARRRNLFAGATRWLRRQRRASGQTATTTRTSTAAPTDAQTDSEVPAPVTSHQHSETSLAPSYRTSHVVSTAQGNPLYGDPSSMGYARSGEAEAQYRRGMSGGGWGPAI